MNYGWSEFLYSSYLLICFSKTSCIYLFDLPENGKLAFKERKATRARFRGRLKTNPMVLYLIKEQFKPNEWAFYEAVCFIVSISLWKQIMNQIETDIMASLQFCFD